MDSEENAVLPSLDVRDLAPSLTRRVLRAAPASAFAQYISAATGAAAIGAADAVLFIRTRLLEELSRAVPPVVSPAAPAELRESRDSLQLQEELLVRLHEQWAATEQARRRPRFQWPHRVAALPWGHPCERLRR